MFQRTADNCIVYMIKNLKVLSVSEWNDDDDNDLKKKKTISSLKFPVRPRIAPFDFGDQQIYAGQSAQLSCMVVGDLPLTWEWRFDGKKLTPESSVGYRISQVGPRSNILLIDPVDSIHSGTYECIVRSENLSGNDTQRATLRVYG